MAGAKRADQERSLAEDCRDLARYVVLVRQQIASMRPHELKSEEIPSALKQMDAVVKATEQATNTIMEAAEEIMGAETSDPEAYQAQVMDCCMRIFEACSFQDITGQRVSKVLKTLQGLDENLVKLQKAIGDELQDAPKEVLDPDDERNLLQGPALEDDEVDQQTIDQTFDKA